MAGDGQEQGGEGRGSGRGGGKAGSGENVGGMRDARRIRAGKSDLRSAGFRMASTRQPLIGILITTLAVARIWAIDPASEGGENVAWTMRPNPEDESQLHGWRDLQGFRILKPDDSHYGDRFGRTVSLHGDHLIVGADYSTCTDGSYSPGGSCTTPGKGAVYIFEQDYVTSPYYRWGDSSDTGSWGGYPTTNSASSNCDEFGENCIATVGFCTDTTGGTLDGAACQADGTCTGGTCRFAPPFTVAGSKYWGQRKKLQPSDLTNGDGFGAAIAFDGVTNTLVVGAPKQEVAARCGIEYYLGVREGSASGCAEAGAVYVFQKDFGGVNNWGQVAKFTSGPGVIAGETTVCGSGVPSAHTGTGTCPSATCHICTSQPEDGTAQTHMTMEKQHFGASVSIDGDYIAVGCPRCVGNNKCQGRCLDSSFCGRCNITTTTECIFDTDCPDQGAPLYEVCEPKCQDGSDCTRWSQEINAGKVFLYKNTGSDAWTFLKEVVPQPTGGFDELKNSYNGGQWCGNRAQGVCGTDGTIVCTIDADCDLTGGICQGGSNGGNACTSDAQCPGSGLCSTTCGNLVHDPILFTCCRDGDQFGASVSVFQDSNEGDYVLAVGVLQDTTTVALGESYDRSNHGSVYLFQSNLCCMNGPAYATAGSDCDAPYSTTDCADTWGQVKGILSSGRAHQSPVNTATTCGQFALNGRDVPWVSTHTENHQQYYCWHTEKITAIDEDRETFFGRQVFLSECESTHGATSTCLMVSRGSLYADEMYVYVRNKPGYILEDGGTASGTGTGYLAAQFGYGASFKNQWGLYRKHCDDNYQCPPTKNSGYVQSSTALSTCTCTGGFKDGQSCTSDAECSGGDQTGLSGTPASDCHDGQDNFGKQCTVACECTSGGYLCSWYAGSLGTNDASGTVTDTRWQFSTTVKTGNAIPADCPGGVIDSGTIAEVTDPITFTLANTAAAFQGIYLGFKLRLKTDGYYETRTITGYTAERIVTIDSTVINAVTTSTTYEVLTSGTWVGYPTDQTECPGSTTIYLTSTTNFVAGGYIMIDDEIFMITAVVDGEELSTLRARSGSVAAAHAAETGVYLLSGTGIDNIGISASDQMIADLQTSTSTRTGGILRRCASITLDAFSADATDNIYRNWYISITSGPGVAQSARILHYDGDLKMAIIDCVEHGQSWTGYAQAGFTTGFTGQGYGAFASSGNNPTPCRRSWIVPPGHSYRYFRLRVTRTNTGWTDTAYSPGLTATGCALSAGWSIQEIELYQDSNAVVPVASKLTVNSASNPDAQGGTATTPYATSLAINGCPASRGTTGLCTTYDATWTPNTDDCDSNAFTGTSPCGTVAKDGSDSFTMTSSCGATPLTPLILDLGSGNQARVDRYRFAQTTAPTSSNYEITRWVLEGTNDGTAAGGDAWDPYGFCGTGDGTTASGSCVCSSTGLPACSTAPAVYNVGTCFCRSRWDTLDDRTKEDYSYDAAELVRGAFVPSITKNGGYFIVPKSTYQLCENPVDSNGVCNQGPCTEVACAGPTGDVDPLATDYLKQAKAYATQYLSNTNMKDSSWNEGSGTTSGGATGSDVTGRPMWGNPVSADTAKAATGRTDEDLMAVGDFGYDDKGAVFLMRRQPASDYIKYMDRYEYYPMPLPNWVD